MFDVRCSMQKASPFVKGGLRGICHPTSNIQHLTGAVILLAAALLSACAPLQSPAPVYSPSSGRPATPEQQPSSVPPQQEVPEQNHKPEMREPPPAIMPDEEAMPPAVAAVATLVDRAWASYGQGDYEGAIVVAERAQRLDARNPDVYLVMAQAHLARARLSAAEQLAKKGIAFSQAGTLVRARLQDLLREIAALR